MKTDHSIAHCQVKMEHRALPFADDHQALSNLLTEQQAISFIDDQKAQLSIDIV